MKKSMLTILILCASLFTINSTFACSCGCKKINCNCENYKSCPQECDCGCHDDKKCENKNCDCKCHKKFKFNIF